MKPGLQEFATNNAWYTAVGTVDIDAERDLMDRFKVQAVPTLLVFRDGELLEEIQGFDPKLDLGDIVYGK